MIHLTAFLCPLVRRGSRCGAHPPQAGRNAASGQRNTAFGGAEWVNISDLWYNLWAAASRQRRTAAADVPGSARRRYRRRSACPGCAGWPLNTIEEKGAGESGAVTLVFSDHPFALRKWEVVDAQGMTTQVALVDPQFDVEIDKGLFDYGDLDIYGFKGRQKQNK